MADETKVGVVSKFFAKPSVAAINLEGEIKVGDILHFKGVTTDFEQKIDSMQIDNAAVEKAGVGQSVGIKVKDRVRENDEVFKLS